MTALLAVLQQAAPGGNPFTGFLPIILIFFIFYFIVIRPQTKQRKQLETSLMAIKRGDEIVTAGGLVGEIVHIKEGSKDGQPARTMEDRVTIKSGEARVVVERGRIARVITKSAEPAAS